MDFEKLENSVRDRIKLLQKTKRFTENKLAAGNTPAQKRLNRQLSHGAGISLDTLLRILEACPDVSADWLLRGTGEMYITSNQGITGAGKVTGKNATIIGQQGGVISESFIHDLLAEKDKQISTLLSILGK